MIYFFNDIFNPFTVIVSDEVYVKSIKFFPLSGIVLIFGYDFCFAVF